MARTKVPLIFNPTGAIMQEFKPSTKKLVIVGVITLAIISMFVFSEKGIAVVTSTITGLFAILKGGE